MGKHEFTLAKSHNWAQRPCEPITLFMKHISRKVFDSLETHKGCTLILYALSLTPMSAPVDTSPEGILSLTRPADGKSS